MDINAHRNLLVQEARELLQAMENALLAIENSGADAEQVNAIFRAAHTIKGSAGLFGLDTIVEFTHVLESVLVRVRENELALDKPLIDLTLACGDHIGGLIDCIESGSTLDTFNADRREQLVQQLRDRLNLNRDMKHAAEAGVATANDSISLPSLSKPLFLYKLQLQLNPDVLAHGMDPLSLFQYLATLGEIIAIKTDISVLPALWEIDPERCYLRFALEMRSSADKAALDNAFEFVREGSEIIIEIETPEVESPVASVNEETKADTVLAGTVRAAANTTRDNTASRDNTLLKVESRKLDELIDVVGELVIRMAGCDAAAQNNPVLLKELFAGMHQLVEQIRDRSLNLRMVPVGEVFQRFPRLVRDVCSDLGKEIDLTIVGAETELDKSMVEKLSDPLIHIVRNAIDHGIEASAERVAAGKPARGALKLNAFHQSGAIVIEVSDDGRGLNRQRILQKARDRGLIAADTRLSDKEIDELIFLPGFSTAEAVTDLSGRGVGMDVVRKNIDSLRGSIDIHSQAGAGTTMQIRLPLTLAIIDGFQVQVGDADFVLPLNMVEECLDLRDEDISQSLFDLRGRPLPFIRLADVFAIPTRPCARQCLLVLRVGDNRAGIVVDRFVGELQAVIKPLGELLKGVAGFSGSTILGDGRVALLLDVPALLASAPAREIPPQESVDAAH